MKVTFDKIKEEENPALKEEVLKDTELKKWLVGYVGQKKQPDDDKVTVEMVLEVISEEFPDFVLPIAEENWIRGYEQALVDVDEGQRLMQTDSEKEQENE